jgi:hypothetical protein
MDMVNDRIRFVPHRRKQILLVDFSNCPASQVEATVRALPDIVTTQPRKSVLILCDFNGASFNEEAVRAMKEAAVFNKPFISKTAWVGATSFPEVFFDSLKNFSRREFPVFDTQIEALDWLVKD